jgi:hypothetical protein
MTTDEELEQLRQEKTALCEALQERVKVLEGLIDSLQERIKTLERH